MSAAFFAQDMRKMSDTQNVTKGGSIFDHHQYMIGYFFILKMVLIEYLFTFMNIYLLDFKVFLF